MSATLPPKGPKGEHASEECGWDAVIDGPTTRRRFVDTVIIGTGPSALILSYILNGYQPCLRADITHPDPQLQAKLAGISSLLHADFHHLVAHFPASRFNYSTQALPINTLLDTLLRPLGDTAPGLHESCLEWRPTGQKVDHLVLGLDCATGGQWQGNSMASSDGIAALSYADLLTLPGYTMAQHLRERGIHDDMGFLRPARRDVSEYLTIWANRVGIESSLWLGRRVQGIGRTSEDGFHIASHQLHCRRIVLATGAFTEPIPPPQLLRPLLNLTPPKPSALNMAPLLVIGSGFSAADIVLTALSQNRCVLHMFMWDASNVTSPLRACHPSAYPEYASVFRRMRRAASKVLAPQPNSPGCCCEVQKRRKSSTYVLKRTERDVLYEGLPNAVIRDVNVRQDQASASILLERPDGGQMEREISGLQYVIGRRGSMAYLDREIRSELFGSAASLKVIDTGRPIQASALRSKVENTATLEMVRGIFAIGSLLGDSLVRHAYGGCVVVSRELLRDKTVQPTQATAATEAHGANRTSSKGPEIVRAASDEVAEAVALAFSGEEPFAVAHRLLNLPLTGIEPSARRTTRLTADNPYPISLEFSEPPSLPWPVQYTPVALVCNDHEHLGDTRHAILGKRTGAWCECSNGPYGAAPERHVHGEEVTAF